mgnify:CR=1 FL=1
MCKSNIVLGADPIIREVNKNDLNECLEVIHKSFSTVAEQFGLTKENCPKHTSFIPIYFLETQMNWGWHMFALCSGEKIVGYMSLSKEDDNTFELHNLAVLPEFRHNGYGKMLLDFFELCRKKMPIGYAKFHLPWVLEWCKANRQYKQAFELLNDFPENLK